MFSKIIAFTMSLIMTVTGTVFSFADSVVDSVFEAVCGIPFTSSAVKDGFLSEFGKDDIGFVDGETGYIKNTLAVFVDGDLSFFERLRVLRECGGAVIGWCAPAELYVVGKGNMTHEKVISECERIEELDGVALAMPLYLSKTEEQLTPDDPFDYMIDKDTMFSENPVEWNELRPDGRNWWLEAIDARQAWDYEERFQPVSLGVLDSGFDLEHPELTGKITFPNEKRARKNRPSDHGCHVAGIIAAERNNSTGVSGICDHADLICVDWNPDLFQLWFTEIAIYFGFTELVQAGAKVINLSLGISASVRLDRSSLYDRVIKPRAMSLTMASLLDKGYDFLVVQSAGNGNKSGDPIDSTNNGHFTAITEKNVYTGKYEIGEEEILGRIISVSAAMNLYDGSFMQAGYSNVGPYIDIAAPGSLVYSCGYPAIADYTYKSGTSMAAPCVTGVAGLVWSVNPEFTGKDVKEIIVTSTDKTAVINDYTEYFFNVELMDYPMLNAKLAVEEAIKRTDKTVGTVTGKLSEAVSASVVEFDGTEYTVLPDGSFSFVAPAASGTATVKNSDGEEIGSFELSFSAGETVDLGII